MTVEAMFAKTRNERQQKTEEKEEVKEGAMLQDSQMNNTYFGLMDFCSRRSESRSSSVAAYYLTLMILFIDHVIFQMG